jgi:hypothetical protein
MRVDRLEVYRSDRSSAKKAFLSRVRPFRRMAVAGYAPDL